MEIKTEYDADFGPTEMTLEEVNPTPTPSSFRRISIWSNVETKKLLDLYKTLIIEVGPLNRLLRKKDMWAEISTHYPNKTAKQCEERFKTVLRRRKKFAVKSIDSDEENTFEIIKQHKANENTFEIIRNYKVQKADDVSTSMKSVYAWSNSETKQLMELHKHLITEVGPRKRFQRKKDMWDEISSHFSRKDPKQCEQRYNTIIQRKKKVYISRKRRKTIDLQAKQRLNNLFQNKSVSTIEKNEIGIDNDIKTDNNEDANLHEEMYFVEPTIHENEEIKSQPSRELTLHEILLDIQAKREEGKERRHKEKLEAVKKMQNILQQLLDLKNNQKN